MILRIILQESWKQHFIPPSAFRDHKRIKPTHAGLGYAWAQVLWCGRGHQTWTNDWFSGSVDILTWSNTSKHQAFWRLRFQLNGKSRYRKVDHKHEDCLTSQHPGSLEAVQNGRLSACDPKYGAATAEYFTYSLWSLPSLTPKFYPVFVILMSETHIFILISCNLRDVAMVEYGCWKTSELSTKNSVKAQWATQNWRRDSRMLHMAMSEFFNSYGF